MSNEYYNNQHTLNKHELAKGSDVENKLDGVEAGFDKLPSPDDFATILTPYVTTTATGNEYAVPLDISAYIDGMTVNVKLDAPNTGPVTLNVNNLGPVSLLLADFVVLQANDLIINSILECRYNGTVFIMTSGTPGIISRSEAAADTAIAAADTAIAAADTAIAAVDTATAAADTATAAATESQLSYWDSKASEMTADSYAVQPVGDNVIIFTSNDNGTFTQTLAEPQPVYSALHWASKANNTDTQAGKNLLINGDFSVWQRGYSFSNATHYMADRWSVSG
ncbi:MAG: hypothetical protein DRJ15_10590, partial [Bacteroidetes bacterium]